MAEENSFSRFDTSDDEDSGEEENGFADNFRYMPLDESQAPGDMPDLSSTVERMQISDSAENGAISAFNGSSKYGGYASSGCESSDIEVIQESSDSIEVLEPGHLDNIQFVGAVDNQQERLDNEPRELVDNDRDRDEAILPVNNEELDDGGGAENEQNYRERVVDGAYGGLQPAPRKHKHDKDALNIAEAVHGDNLSIQDGSDTTTIHSSSSTCSNAGAEDLMDVSQSYATGPKPNLEAEAREIFAAIDALDRERSEGSDSPASSSLSPSPFDSPSHRPLIPLEPNIVFDNGSGRPDSLSLPRPLQFYEKRRFMKKDSSASSLSDFSSRSSSMDALIEAATVTPLRAQGTVTTEGDMVAFVASGLDQMIKMSSPLSRKDSASFSGNMTPRSVTSMSSSASGWSTSSASGWSYSGLSRSPSVLTQSPDDIPPIDPRALMDLEVHARRVATSLDHMMGTLKNNLFKMSSLTSRCLDAYGEGIENTCDAVDNGIKSMYALMAKCEELSKKMGPIYKLRKEIQEINRLLDLFESQMIKADRQT